MTRRRTAAGNSNLYANLKKKIRQFFREGHQDPDSKGEIGRLGKRVMAYCWGQSARVFVLQLIAERSGKRPDASNKSIDAPRWRALKDL
jgi:hypothetical protein